MLVFQIAAAGLAIALRRHLALGDWVRRRAMLATLGSWAMERAVGNFLLNLFCCSFCLGFWSGMALFAQMAAHGLWLDCFANALASACAAYTIDEIVERAKR